MTMEKKLDYELRKNYYLRLEVRFAVGYKARTTVIIEVRDDNDVTPNINVQPSLAFITPNFPVGSYISDIRVDDVDTENSYYYNITGGDNPNPIFKMEPHGQITTRRCLTDADVNLYELTVRVNDGKRWSNTRIITVRVKRSEAKDFKDHCGLDCREYGHPSTYAFTNGLYTKTIKENAPRNTFIQQVCFNLFYYITFITFSFSFTMPN